MREANGPESRTLIPAKAWVSIATAAAFLGLSPDRLRKTLERHARKADGVLESNVDGVTARKFGRLWRVRFSAAWTEPKSP